MLQVEEADAWREVVVYQGKADGSIVLWFGGDEYEGIGKGYTLVTRGTTHTLLDPDGDEIKWRVSDKESALEWTGPGTVQGQLLHMHIILAWISLICMAVEGQLPPAVATIQQLLQDAVASNHRPALTAAVGKARI